MKRTFQLGLPNGLFGDPLVVVRVRWLSRVLLLDCGDVAALSGRTLLDVTDVLISHAHVDHIFGLGRLLRARMHHLERPLRLIGPSGLADRVRSHLHGYTWNLVKAFPLDLTVVEIDRDALVTRRFPREDGLEPVLVEERAWNGSAPVFQDDLLAVHSCKLHHGSTTSLGYRVTEHVALSVDAARLEQSGWPPGSWLDRLKSALRKGAADDETIEVPGAGPHTIKVLRDQLIRERKGDSVAYAADLSDQPRNREALRRIASSVRALVLEAHFLERDRDLAERHAHLTAAAAGRLAKRLEPEILCPFHVSSRYEKEEHSVWSELEKNADPVRVEKLPAGDAGRPEQAPS